MTIWMGGSEAPTPLIKREGRMTKEELEKKYEAFLDEYDCPDETFVYPGHMFVDFLLEWLMGLLNERDTGAVIDRLREERECYRAVLEGAGYQNLDAIAENGVLMARALGCETARVTQEILMERDVLRICRAARARGEG